MTYIDGFVAAVPTANKDVFREDALVIDQLSIKHGATQVIEAWGDDVPKEETTDFLEPSKPKRTKRSCFHGCSGRTKPHGIPGMKRYLLRYKLWATRR